MTLLLMPASSSPVSLLLSFPRSAGILRPTSRTSYGFLHEPVISDIGSPSLVIFTHTHSSINSIPHCSKMPLDSRIISWKVGLFVIQSATIPSGASRECIGMQERRDWIVDVEEEME